MSGFPRADENFFVFLSNISVARYEFRGNDLLRLYENSLNYRLSSDVTDHSAFFGLTTG